MALSYKNLLVWKESMALVTEIYRLSGEFPRSELFGLVSQMRRAAISIPSNIAEGKGRQTAGEFLQFLIHARGSLLELETQIQIAENLGYLDAEKSEVLKARTAQMGKMLNRFIDAVKGQKYLKKLKANSRPLPAPSGFSL